MRALLFVAMLSLSACKHSEPVEDPPPASTPPASNGGGSGPAMHIFLPPAEGTSRFVAEGCAAKPEEAEKNANTRGGMPSGDKVTPSATGTGIIDSHDLAHACCLKAESAADIQGTSVTITETLSGTPCRCMCSSTLKTAVGLKKGTWQVSLKTVEGGNTKASWSGELEVK